MAIKKFANHCPHLKTNQSFYLGFELDSVQSVIKKINFPNALIAGHSFLPPASFGPVSRFNANGKLVIDRKAGKETVFIPVRWKWTQWHGKDRVEKEEVRYRQMERWKRKSVPAPGVEFQVCATTNDRLLILSPLLKNKQGDNEQLCHVFSLFKEVFGAAPNVYADNLNAIIKAKLHKLNWTTLPQGALPWNQMQQRLTPVLRGKTPNQKFIINFRFETVNSYSPDFVAIGNLGFYGYVVFGFLSKRLFVLESIHKDNATYVFDTNWQSLSQKSKAEIIQGNLAKHRVIHRKDWQAQIHKILK